MNPLAAAALGSIIRWVLAMGAVFFVDHGIWSKPDAEQYIAAASLAIISLGWSQWDKYKGRIKILTAISLIGAPPKPSVVEGVYVGRTPPVRTEAELDAHIASGVSVPSVTTPVNKAPIPVPAKP